MLFCSTRWVYCNQQSIRYYALLDGQSQGGKCEAAASLRTTTHSSAIIIEFRMKVAVLGAAGGIGQALALLLKTQLPSGSELSLYDIAPPYPYRCKNQRFFRRRRHPCAGRC
ncbi:hypothetical protein RF11_01316 [Thelohanellus kitauei]|uniref:Malate dehydrogenase, mitochondrial n=1 Tax=Thelohanellus kitauei TaxID=669202 RepID=A0A0C2J513_THEKT|nr:hypothetical protein RF11_01316 [Thelohanellus kitauei]